MGLPEAETEGPIPSVRRRPGPSYAADRWNRSLLIGSSCVIFR
jgi:hypothetical protein